MSEQSHQLPELLEEHLGALVTSIRCVRHEVTMDVSREHTLEVCQVLRDALDFRQLVDLCGIDYLGYGQSEWETSESATLSGFSRGVDTAGYEDANMTERRFAVIYHLLSHAENQRVRMRVYAQGDPPRVDSVVCVWKSADWYEREAFDLFGILFDGHPDLRRLLTDYGFVGHPFRKDFPLSGRVEARYDPERQRVIYEPVSIEPRTLVPRVVREDHRYDAADASGEDSADA